MNTGCWPISCTTPVGWCRAPSWWNTFTIRISIATPTPSKFLSAASAKSWTSISSRRCADSAICSRRRQMRARKFPGVRSNSLATRLFLSATAWVVVVLLITGVVLSSVYRSASERAFDRRLNLYLRTLIAEVTAPDEPADHQFQSLGEPLFDLPLSGWYWEIDRSDPDKKKETRASRSLWDNKLPKLEDQGIELSLSGVRVGYVDGPEGQTLRMVERPV